MTKTPLTDAELDKILQSTRQPELPEGFAGRLQARLEAEQRSNVIAFPLRKIPTPSSRRIWLSAIPLVASLAAGLYIGTLDSIPASLAALESTLVADATDQTIGSGFEDTEAFVNGDLS
jgi:hypothetical protein